MYHQDFEATILHEGWQEFGATCRECGAELLIGFLVEVDVSLSVVTPGEAQRVIDPNQQVLL
jgi:hypothetical protein